MRPWRRGGGGVVGGCGGGVGEAAPSLFNVAAAASLPVVRRSLVDVAA
jgi:hypothetical protein